MAIVSIKDLKKAIPLLHFPGGDFLANLLYRIMKLEKINNWYDQMESMPGPEFIEKTIEVLGFQYDVKAEEYQNIPGKGPFIMISNHPYGGIDGIILLKILPSIRPDFKILMNFMLARIKPIETFGFTVNPFEKIPSVFSSYAGLREAMGYLKNGHPIGLFPAGEVASFQVKSGKVTDKQWPHSIIKMILKARVPVIPVYFGGHNSAWFYLLGMIHPALRTACLPSELFNKSGKTIKVRIGRPVSVREQEKFRDIKEFRRYLRMRIFSLGIQGEKQGKEKFFRYKKPMPVISPVSTETIADEIEKLKQDSLLFSMNNHYVFCSPSVKIPGILKELGRLREITYREVGEGTNKSIDLDAFDLYYRQLFIWNADEKKIIGGYRVGFGNEIMESNGIKGFYISTLFHIRDEITPLFSLSMELGRSFIIRSFQKKPLSLFLLWKGILQLLIRHPEFQYMIGPVSISNSFSELSKGLTVTFLKKNYFNKDFAELFVPRKHFIPRINPVIRKRLFHKITGNNLNNLDHFIQSFDPGFRVPVLIKKYLSVNAEVVGFNVDPKFNNCLDVLLITNINDIPKDTIKSLLK